MNLCLDPSPPPLADVTVAVGDVPTSIPYGEVKITIVPPSRNTQKKYFCTFCKKLVSKIARHLELVHKNEESVNAFSVLPKCE